MTRVIFETQRDATLRDARRRRRPGEEVRGGDFRERARCRRRSCAKCCDTRMQTDVWMFFRTMQRPCRDAQVRPRRRRRDQGFHG